MMRYSSKLWPVCGDAPCGKCVFSRDISWIVKVPPRKKCGSAVFVYVDNAERPKGAISVLTHGLDSKDVKRRVVLCCCVPARGGFAIWPLHDIDRSSYLIARIPPLSIQCNSRAGVCV